MEPQLWLMGGDYGSNPQEQTTAAGLQEMGENNSGSWEADLQVTVEGHSFRFMERDHRSNITGGNPSPRLTGGEHSSGS